MKIKRFALLMILCCLSSSCLYRKSVTHTELQNSKQAYDHHTPVAHHTVALEVLEASKRWIHEFNRGNVSHCIDAYDSSAVMRAMPFGLKKGIKEISDFWTPFVQSGATDLIYTNLSIQVIDEQTAVLSANWSMNVGEGIIYQEKWEKKENRWMLTYDDFEVLKKYSPSKKEMGIQLRDHQILKDVILSSIHWTNSFNSQDVDFCANSYVKHATMNAVPFASLHTRGEIREFWHRLIKDGATNLTYHNPTFKVITPTRVLVSASWSMNIGQGVIYQERWVQNKDTWMLVYDHFKVLKQY